MHKFIYLIVSLCMVSAVHAQTCNPNIVRTAPDSRYELVVGSGGIEVLDKHTGLIWQRCSLGQNWNGSTCIGEASRHTWTEALAKARAVGNGYRLPNIRELKSLTEKACAGPAINRTFFPNTVYMAQSVDDGYWSASPDTYNGEYVGGVNFSLGYTENYYKGHYLHVRAVRASK